MHIVNMVLNTLVYVALVIVMIIVIVVIKVPIGHYVHFASNDRT